MLHWQLLRLDDTGVSVAASEHCYFRRDNAPGAAADVGDARPAEAAQAQLLADPCLALD